MVENCFVICDYFERDHLHCTVRMIDRGPLKVLRLPFSHANDHLNPIFTVQSFCSCFFRRYLSLYLYFFLTWPSMAAHKPFSGAYQPHLAQVGLVLSCSFSIWITPCGHSVSVCEPQLECYQTTSTTLNYSGGPRYLMNADCMIINTTGVDTHIDPPLKPAPSNTSRAKPAITLAHRTTTKIDKPKDLATSSIVLDRHSEICTFYPDVPSILVAARARNIKIAAASRTYAPELAREMLSLLKITEHARAEFSSAEGFNIIPQPEGAPREENQARRYFDDLQIFPGDKVRHVDMIKARTGVEYKDMLFFDDEARNANVERERGVAFWLVRDGMTVAEVDSGVKKWREKQSHGGGDGDGKTAEAKSGREQRYMKKKGDIATGDGCTRWIDLI